MRAVLMAGGEGTRLRPLTCDLPKPMVPILNRPIAEHIVNLLKQHQIHEIIATLYYLPDVMRDYFRDGSDFGVQMTYGIEEEQALGTAGCVKNISALLTDTFLVISGDCITDFDLTAALHFHHAHHSKATIVLARVPNPMEFGVVITDPQQRICRFLEKPSTSEVFSDTVNTGIYILEPEVLDYLPSDQPTDFSKDLFPLLLEKNEPMFGYVAEGYWCDVGSLDSYREAQYDALHGKVKLEFAYQERQPGLWIGQNAHIDSEAKLCPPLLIGDNCRIGSRVNIESGTVIGDNVTIGSDADLKRPIIWNGALVGEESHLRACAIARGARVDRRAHVLEGAVVGALSTVGEEAQVSPGVRVWPSKNIEPGATLNINLIWGSTAPRNLFGQRGVAGLANVDITPEFAVKLGAAYASTLKPGSQVTISRDQRSISRMVSRSLISGIMSVGIDVQNLEATALPIARCVPRNTSVIGGVHVRIHPDRTDFILIEFFDAQGINISKTKEKKIEGAYFKEDFRRAAISEIGGITYPTGLLDDYAQIFEKWLNTSVVRQGNFKVVIDYVYAVSGAILPRLLSKFGCDAVVLNASLRAKGPTPEQREELLIQLGLVVEALKANFGVQVSANGEQLVLVDETGSPIQGEQLTALMVEIILITHPRGAVVVPVNTSSAVEQIARRHDATVIRTKANPTALMETCRTNPNVVLGGSADTGFIFPQLHPGFDAMFSIAKLIEMLTLQQKSLGQLKADLPRIFHRKQTVRCPWNRKGALMRYLVENHPSSSLELIDGVKVKDPGSDNWTLILPDAGEPLVHIFANGCDREWVDASLQDYRQQIQEFTELDVNLDHNLDKP
ncbi:MAG: NTP transferase domain-containing protein [Acaryochloris sp. RU_4_1]|nr:NTP transferase domain-containing protein [Acaryochloris sp. RU_4_1]NJR54424.1 NTP transferase domain-containing protein [Acaryochloris sp. CRU_2_0]